MPNIQLNYLYRDYANYKNHGVAIFANPDNYSLEQFDAIIRTHLLDGEWFRATRWGLNDLHFEKYDDENDHPYHTFESVELTDDAVTEAITVTEFLAQIIKADNSW